MFSSLHTRKNRAVFTLFLLAMLSLTVQAVYAQDSSSSAAKPALPASDNANSGKDVAKTELPATSTDVTAPRVASYHSDTYIIGVDDVLAINVWKEAELSRSTPVRPDGMITLPLVGEIKASGLTPNQLQDQITTALQKVMSDPVVTVSVTGVNSLSFNIMGQVNKPGYFPLTHPLTVLDAIALAGGFRDFAKQKKIYVLRTATDGKQQKLYFNYKEVIKGKKMAQNIYLQPRDTLVVP